MYIHFLHCGLEAPVSLAVTLAKTLRIYGDRVAFMDMSRAYKTSMLANDMAVNEREGATLPWIERLVTPDEIAMNVVARLTDTDVPVFRGMPDPIKAREMSANECSEQLQIATTNLQLMEKLFDFVIGVSEFVLDDVTGFFALFSDRIFLYGNSEIEVGEGAFVLQKFFPKLVVCLGINVPAQYRHPSGNVGKIIPNYETFKAVRHLQSLHKKGSLTAETREGRIATVL